MSVEHGLNEYMVDCNQQITETTFNDFFLAFVTSYKEDLGFTN